MKRRQFITLLGARTGEDNMSVVTETCEHILEAYETGKPIAPVRDRIRGVADAYAVQQACVDVWLAHGRTVAGHKIGLTSKAVQQQLGVDQPDFGILFADSLDDGADVASRRVMQPRIEADLHPQGRSEGERLSAEDAVNATSHLSAIEIWATGWPADIRIADDRATPRPVWWCSARHG
jgi:2-keto-4-pentenoate hydratase